jgi:hypothetical protein
MTVRNFTVALLCVSTVAFAQKGGSISIGATPGLSYMLAQNTYYLADNTKELDYRPKFSYHLVLQGGYNFKEQHGIVAYVNYCDEGQRYQDEFKYKIYPALVGTHKKSVDFKYMGLGVLYRFAPLLAGQKQHIRSAIPHFRMKLLAGIETDVLLNAQMKYTVDLNNSGNVVNYGYPIPYQIPGYPVPAPPNGQPGYGFSGYSPNGSDNYKSYFKTLQAVLVVKYGFDYIFNNNMYIGVALETKFGLNDINAKPYRIHPDYKKSKNYFFGLNFELGYVFQNNGKPKVPKEEKAKPAKVKTPGVDLNRKVDKVDKRTRKKMKKTAQ